MKSLNNYIIRKSSEDEHDEMILQMSENLHNENPKVGIFWYNAQRNELFGVVKYDPLDKEKCSRSNRGYTCKILHKQYWAKEFRRLKFKEKKTNTFPYIGAYENKPRGRVFWDNENNIYKIVVGNWINKDENYRAIDIVAKEFDFDKEDFEVIIDDHWDIGSDWKIYKLLIISNK